MPITEYNDKSLKDIRIFPDVVNFGILQKNAYYKTKILVLNQDSMGQRIRVKSPQYCSNIFIIMEQGLIAPGMKRNISIEINTKDI